MALLILLGFAALGPNLVSAADEAVPGPAANPPVYESEPNDNPMESNVLGPGRTMAGFLQEGNADFFSFDVSGEIPRPYSISLVPARDSDPSLRVEGPAGIVVSTDTAGQGLTESIPWVNLKPGRYFIVVSGRGTNIKEPYRLTAKESIAPSGFIPESEPNGDPGTIQALTPEAVCCGICLPGDVDLFTMANPPASSPAATLVMGGVSLEAFESRGQTVTVAVLDALGGLIKTLGKVNPSEGFEYTFTPMPQASASPESPGFVIRVSGTGNTPVGYSLSLLCGADSVDRETEINDTPQDADPIVPGKICRATIFPRGDIDWFELKSSAETGELFSFTGSGPGAVRARLVDPSKGAEKNFPAHGGAPALGTTKEGSPLTGATIEFRFELTAGSRVFIMLGCTTEPDSGASARGPDNGFAEPSGEYEFLVTNLGPPDTSWESEINDTPGSAKVLADQQRVFGTIDGRGRTADVDFFHLSAPGEGVFDLRINIDLDPSPPVGDEPPGAVAVSLIGRGERVLDTRIFDPSTVPEGKGTMKFYNLLERDYMIRVAPANGLSGVMGYTLTPKAWELKESKTTADYSETVTVYAPPGGFRSLAVISANGSSGSYRTRFCPPDGRGPFFIGEGAIYKDGLFMKFHRFVREGFYVLDSEMPLRVLGIGQGKGPVCVVSGNGGSDAYFPEGVDPAESILEFAGSFGASIFQFTRTRSYETRISSGSYIFLGALEERGVELTAKPSPALPVQDKAFGLPLPSRCILRGSAALDLSPVTHGQAGPSGSEPASVRVVSNDGPEQVSEIASEGILLDLPQGETRLRVSGGVAEIRRIILNKGSLLVLHSSPRTSPDLQDSFVLEGDEEFKAMKRTHDVEKRSK